jgi:hypothetical protein
MSLAWRRLLCLAVGAVLVGAGAACAANVRLVSRDERVEPRATIVAVCKPDGSGEGRLRADWDYGQTDTDAHLEMDFVFEPRSQGRSEATKYVARLKRHSLRELGVVSGTVGAGRFVVDRGPECGVLSGGVAVSFDLPCEVRAEQRGIGPDFVSVRVGGVVVHAVAELGPPLK